MIQTINNGNVFAAVQGPNGLVPINYVTGVTAELARTVIMTNSTSYGRLFGTENPIEGRMFKRMYKKGKKVPFSIVGEIGHVLGSSQGDCAPYPQAGKINGFTREFDICSFKAKGKYCIPDFNTAFADSRQWLGSLSQRQQMAAVAGNTGAAPMFAHVNREWLTRIGNEITWGSFFGLSDLYTINTANTAAPFWNGAIPEWFNPSYLNDVNVSGGSIGGLCQDQLIKQMVDAVTSPNAEDTSSYYFDTSAMLTPEGAVNTLLAAIARFPEKWTNANFPVEKRLKIWCHPTTAQMVKRYYTTNAAKNSEASAYNELMREMLGLSGLGTDIAMLDFHYPVIPIAAWQEFDGMRGAMKTTNIGGVPIYHSRNLMCIIGFDEFAGSMTTFEDQAAAGTYGMVAQMSDKIEERGQYTVIADVEYGTGTIAHKNNPFALGYPATQTFS